MTKFAFGCMISNPTILSTHYCEHYKWILLLWRQTKLEDFSGLHLGEWGRNQSAPGTLAVARSEGPKPPRAERRQIWQASPPRLWTETINAVSKFRPTPLGSYINACKGRARMKYSWFECIRQILSPWWHYQIFPTTSDTYRPLLTATKFSTSNF